MNLRKKWGHYLATYAGPRWAALNFWCHGDGHVELNCYDGRQYATVRFRPCGGNVEDLLRTLLAKPDSVPAYALSDALREEMEGDPEAIRLSDMLKATL